MKIIWEGVLCTFWLLFSSAAISRGGHKFIPGGQPGGPKFLSKGAVFRVVLGDTLVLPCEVENLSNYVLLWRRGSAVLTAATLMVTRDSRFRLVDGYNLEISDVMPQDAGDYVCQISDGNNPDQIHTVEILVPPSIRTTPSNGQVTARKGGSVSLECKASGNPVPNISWSRKDAVPTKEKLEGFSITLKSINRTHAGVYQCTASNGVGDPVTVDMQVDVLYSPEIHATQERLHCTEGFDVELVCIVYGEPKPQVTWYHNSFILDQSDRKTIETRGTKHTLTIRQMKDSDLGNYSCVAENNLGKDKKFLELSGRPTPPVFENKGVGRYREIYNLSWSIESFEPFLEVRLLYKLVQPNMTEHGKGEWHDVLLHPSCPNIERKDPKCEMWHVIRGLQPGSQYEAICQAKNKYGWSGISLEYYFYTRATVDYDNYLEPDMKDLGLLSSDGSSCVRISAGLCWIVVYWLANV